MVVHTARWTGLALVAAAGSCLLAAGLPVTAAAAAPAAVAPAASGLPAGSEYVALGDSYSAGYGIAPSTGQPVPGCAQSAQDYPHQVATALGLALTDVTCSGAVTANIDQTPQTEFPDNGTGTAPLQDTALSATTKLVTVTIGGNDLGFSSIAQQCFAISANGPVAGGTNPKNCKSFLDGPTQTKLATVVVPALNRVLADITAKAPNAKVLVVEYPAVAPSTANIPTAGCFRAALGATGINPPFPTDSYPFTDVDVPFLHEVQADLVAAVDTAATGAGATVVPAFAASDPHSPCAATADQWVNGLTLTGISLNPPSATTVPGALHPNTAGVAFLTGQVQTAIAAAFPVVAPTPTTPAPSPTPSGPQLAATGTTHTAPLTWTALGLVAAGAGVTAVARRRRPARR